MSTLVTFLVGTNDFSMVEESLAFDTQIPSINQVNDQIKWTLQVKQKWISQVYGNLAVLQVFITIITTSTLSFQNTFCWPVELDDHLEDTLNEALG